MQLKVVLHFSHLEIRLINLISKWLTSNWLNVTSTIMTLVVWMVHRLVSSNRPTRQATVLSQVLSHLSNQTLEAQTSLEVLSHLSDQTLEGQFIRSAARWTVGIEVSLSELSYQ